MPPQDRTVRIDPPVAEERPVSALALDECRVAGGDENRFVLTGRSDDAAGRVGDERVAEERDAARPRLVLVADTIGRGDVNAVGDRVRALNRLPAVDLRGAPLFFLEWMPANRGRIEQHVRAAERCDPRGLRV